MLSQIGQWLRGKRQRVDRGQAHMTFGGTSVGRTITRTSLFLKRQLWIWPIVAVLLLALIGWGVSRSIRLTMERSLESELHTLLSVERSMLEKWFKVQESSAQTLANSPNIRRTVVEILAASEAAAVGPSAESPASPGPGVEELYRRLAKELEPSMSAHDFVGYVVADKQQRIVAAFTPSLIGQTVPQYESFLARALDGTPTVSVPFPSVVMLRDSAGRMRGGVPTMFVCAPVRDENLQVVAVLAMRIRPEVEFTKILQLGRIGETGETYAINQDGTMVSNGRFDEALIHLGILPDTDDAASILNVQVRDPGGAMVEGFRPAVRRRELPLTEIAAAAVSGASGVKMTEYRDYRGSPSVGAYAWLPDYHMGLITEVDSAEAFRPLVILQRTFYVLFALLALSSLAIFVFTLIVARLRREAQKAAIEAKQLGQYRLEAKIGAGAMGVVYRGHHAMLRRPTAIKMLNVDKVNEQSIQRFEREVQITCKLNNPHTVAIYDYGRTPEGVFYYAMEYLDGIDLQQLVESNGPQPEGRVISILKQICSSLYEAHSLGLVHRDIKPANIMLNRRGGEPDVVKVLDFGLVKALDEDKQKGGGGMSGTPLYMSPEAIQTPDLIDVRSDLYAVGAVGYFLLTGEPVFRANSLAELCNQHVTVAPEPPSKRLGHPISHDLENALLRCLDKDRSKRPQTARDLAALLERAVRGAAWTLEDAEGWWSRHERGQLGPSGGRPSWGPSGTMVADPASAPPANSSPSAASTPPEMKATANTGLDRTMVHGSEEPD